MRLNLDKQQIARLRGLAAGIAHNTQALIDQHTTVTVERAICRLLGIDGVDQERVPLPNRLVAEVAEAGRLPAGVSVVLAAIKQEYGLAPQTAAEAVVQGKVDIHDLPRLSREEAVKLLKPEIEGRLKQIWDVRATREARLNTLGEGPKPLLYVIVATGNIYEDVVQARAAARAGADIIAVIRTTAQSLLDYVPYGPTTEGFGGTFATQANFRIMRQALDDVGEELHRYIRLVNYCSGLCMPEIAAMGAMERLDMMLNDALYGILFRDINMQRTLTDQHFSRVINGFAGIIINTGEDNYLTTADAVEAAPTVLVSELINEQLGHLSGLPDAQLGLGHAFEIDPGVPDSMLLEIAQAAMIREVFPDAPLKYMPPTKFMSGNIFKGHVMDALFNLTGVLTGQSIQLLGMLTEAIHTPHLQDRYLAIESARYVMDSARSLGAELEFVPDGKVAVRVKEVMDEAEALLKHVSEAGLLAAIEEGTFADISRKRTGGKGLEGVFRKSADYWNPFLEPMLKRQLTVEV
jgi:beta-lysine 5,6-aminomutase alpha subunit